MGVQPAHNRRTDLRYQKLHISSRDPNLTPAKVKEIRKSGQVPAVISRRGSDPATVTADGDELRAAAHRTGIGGLMQLIDESNNETTLGMLKQLQWDPVSKQVLHASFQEVQAKEKVSTTVPVVLVGEPRAVVERSGQIIKNNESIEVEGTVTDLPDAVYVDISGLEIGDVVTAGDVVIPGNIEVKNGSSVICSLAVVREVSLEPEIPAEAAEPELVGKEVSSEESSSEE